MKKIDNNRITRTVSRLCMEANFRLRADVAVALKSALLKERLPLPKKILRVLIENARIASREKIALCQDTGMPVVFVEIGEGMDLSKVNLEKAVQRGVADGYRRWNLRNSIVADPLLRQGKSRFAPAVVHYKFGTFCGLKLTGFPKGFGSENRTKLAMFSPTADREEIMNFVVGAVKEAGPDACPPYILGVGIGGTTDRAAILAKEALLRPISRRNPLKHLAKMEAELLKRVNRLRIGPAGLGGATTALGVNILTYPTHIAGLPVVVNISCHALRSAGDHLK